LKKGFVLKPSLIAKHVGNVIVYLDDFLVYGKTFADCLETTQRLLTFLRDHLWTVNLEKSIITPTQVIYFLGIKIDGSNHALSCGKAKASECLKILPQLQSPLDPLTRMKIMGYLNFYRLQKWGSLAALRLALQGNTNWMEKYFTKRSYQKPDLPAPHHSNTVFSDASDLLLAWQNGKQWLTTPNTFLTSTKPNWWP
jgi:hypothetical protein